MWTDTSPGFDITGTFMGVTAPLSSLYDAIHSRGWEVKTVKPTATGYEAEAVNPLDGQKVKKVGSTAETAVAALLMAITRLDFIRTYTSAWKTTWTHRLAEVALAYSKAPVYDPKAVPAWHELAQDCKRRVETLSDQLQIEAVDNPQPYDAPSDLFEDIKKGHLFVSRANAMHPVWSAEQVVNFRIAHQVLGHAAAGSDFDWHGENEACKQHLPLLSPSAQKALFTECIGRTAYVTYMPGIPAEQKIAFLDEMFEEHQDEENPEGHEGVHPSQSLAPVDTPQIPKASAVLDPNAGWESGHTPTPKGDVPESGAAYTDWGDPLGWDRANTDGLTAKDMAHRLSSGWSQLTHPDGSPNHPQMKKAVVNAFVATLMAARKTDKWGAIHYQHLADAAHLTNDPHELHSLLEGNRVAWNTARKMPHNAHRPHYEAERLYARYLQAKHPEWTHDEAIKRSEQFSRIMLDDEMTKIATELDVKERKLADEKRTTTSQIEIEAAATVKKHLEAIMKPEHDPATDFAHEQTQHHARDILPPGQHTRETPEIDPTVGELFDGKATPELMGAYSSWMGSHLKSIAAVSKRSDHILDAALKDMHDHKGAGHHFRSSVLQMGLPGIDAKTASFAWTLLQPHTSQLAAIDSHALDALGHEPGETNTRDYFRNERELAARRDAAGYGHVPLGSFAMALAEHKRGGDKHNDPSHLRVLNPLDHNHIDWTARAGAATKAKQWKKQAPPWWKATDAAAEEAAQHFQDTIGVSRPGHEVPYREKPVYVAQTASEDQELHVGWGVPKSVRNTISNWASEMDWPEGTELEDPADYHITAAYAEHGHSNREVHKWVRAHEASDLPFEATSVHEFGDGEEKATVILLKSQAAVDHAEELMAYMEGQGIEVSRHDGYKAHLTVAYGPGKPKDAKIDLAFNATDLTVSKPRPPEEKTSGLEDPSPAFDHEDGTSDVGAPGMTIMQHLREHYPLSTEELWAMQGVDVRKTR